MVCGTSLSNGPNKIPMTLTNSFNHNFLNLKSMIKQPFILVFLCGTRKKNKKNNKHLQSSMATTAFYLKIMRDWWSTSWYRWFNTTRVWHIPFLISQPKNSSVRWMRNYILRLRYNSGLKREEKKTLRDRTYTLVPAQVRIQPALPV